MSWAAWAAEEVGRIRAAGRWRAVRDLDGPGPEAHVAGGDGAGRPVVSFASNDYLGLTRHPAVATAAHEALDRWGTGAGAARLVAGSRPVHAELENELATWKKADRALLFPTGYAANVGVLSALAGPDVLLLSDELNHASIVDGCRMARGRGAEVVVYPHGDAEAVDRSLRNAGAARRSMVVTDTVFSMGGDLAPLEELAGICARHGSLLVLDEAHAVLGPEPATGDVEHLLRVGTLSKSLASLGGFVAGPVTLVELLTNRARPFIFTTASPPAVAAAALAALRVLRSPEGDRLRAALAARVAQLAPGHPSPVVPFVVGDEDATLAASARLLDHGLLVPAIRPPTVPPGTSRLRVALSAVHTVDHVERLRAALAAAVAPPVLAP